MRLSAPEKNQAYPNNNTNSYGYMINVAGNLKKR